MCVCVCTCGHAQGSTFFFSSSSVFVVAHFECVPWCFSYFSCPAKRSLCIICADLLRRCHCFSQFCFALAGRLSYEWITCDRQPNDVPLGLDSIDLAARCHGMDRIHCSFKMRATSEWVFEHSSRRVLFSRFVNSIMFVLEQCV